jgi:hypothetical protein
MSVENAWQQKLDRIARVNEESYHCESCGDYYDIDMMCEHDSNIHTNCRDCCEAFYEEEHEDFRSDMD